ncbi:hypothetical protein PR048_005634 [Dryococelus australis]|uniref:Uncharacterized protein n=1 Tax=Dryococelus australis TaxID=614101 RepID=A0ABQ9I8S5_9NEOP|nr:hypothetical protein PR048_005634 [Dryococelus australis]
MYLVKLQSLYVYDSLMDILEKHNLKEKVIIFCADNTNTNFGGVQREGQCNAFFKLQQGLGKKNGWCELRSAYRTDLKDFCDEAEVQYKSMLEYSKTRWLALLPAVKKILHMYSQLKSYFLSQEKCPAVLHTFFSNEWSELWLKFVHVQAAIFNDSVKIMEGNKISYTEVSHFIRNEVKTLVVSGQIDRNYFMGHISNFYHKCIQYLQKYIHQYNEF